MVNDVVALLHLALQQTLGNWHALGIRICVDYRLGFGVHNVITGASTLPDSLKVPLTCSTLDIDPVSELFFTALTDNRKGLLLTLMVVATCDWLGAAGVCDGPATGVLDEADGPEQAIVMKTRATSIEPACAPKVNLLAQLCIFRPNIVMTLICKRRTR